MASAARESDPSIVSSVVVGIGAGTAVLLLYLGGGLMFGSWDLGDFLSHLGVEIVGSLLLAGGFVIAIFAVPVALYLYHGLVSPLVVLVIVFSGWVIHGLLAGILTPETVFGLGLYAFGLAPGYILLYLATGGAEYVLRA